MRIGWSVPLPCPFRASGGVGRSGRGRGRRGCASGCLPRITFALVIGAPVGAVQSCQAKAAAGYTDPGQLATAIKGYAQQKTGTTPATVTCDQNGDTLAYTCSASFATTPAVAYNGVITPGGKSYLVTGHTAAGAATPSPSASPPVSGEAPVTTSGNSGSGGSVYIPHPHIHVCLGHHI